MNKLYGNIYKHFTNAHGDDYWKLIVSFGYKKFHKYSYDVNYLQELQKTLSSLREAGCSYENVKNFLNTYNGITAPSESGIDTGRIIIDTDAMNLYLQKSLKNKGYGKPQVLNHISYGLFRHSSGLIYIDEMDLLCQRKSYIPVKRVELNRKNAWIQTDKDVSFIHSQGSEIRKFYEHFNLETAEI